MMYFRTLARAYMCRDFINSLFERQGISAPVVKVQKTLTGFRVMPVETKLKEK